MPGSPKRDKFYHSTAWKKCREQIILSRYQLCEKCGRKGTEVHHIIPLTDDNVDDPMISLNPDNLMLLCKECHDSIRLEESMTNYVGVRGDVSFDAQGNIIFKK